MSLTIREGISLVRIGLKEVTTDSRLPNKYIYSSLKNNTLFLVQRESDALKLSSNQNFFQPYKCIKMDEAPLIDECCGLKSKCKIWRSCEKLPELYVDDLGIIIKRLSSIDGLTKIILTTPQSIARRLDNPYTKWDKSIYVYYSDGYLYSPTKLKMLQLEGAFVEEVNSPCDENKDCKFFMDREFMIPSKLIDAAISLTVQKLGQVYKQLREDSNQNKSEL